MTNQNEIQVDIKTTVIAPVAHVGNNLEIGKSNFLCSLFGQDHTFKTAVGMEKSFGSDLTYQ